MLYKHNYCARPNFFKAINIINSLCSYNIGVFMHIYHTSILLRDHNIIYCTCV